MKKSVNNKGQISIFIIVAVIVVVLAFLVYFMVIKNSGGEIDDEYFSQAHIKPTITIIQTNILDCMNDISKNALDVIGVQGGFYNKPENYFDIGWAFIPYYYNQGMILMPPKSTVEAELGNYVDDFLNNCIDDLSFDEFELVYEKPNTSVLIRQNEVEFKIDMPVKIKHQDKVMVLELSELPINQESYLYEIIEVAGYITQTHKENSKLMCINCIADMTYDRDLYVDFLDFREAETLVVITENKTRTEPYIFEFLNKYPVEGGVE